MIKSKFFKPLFFMVALLGLCAGAYAGILPADTSMLAGILPSDNSLMAGIGIGIAAIGNTAPFQTQPRLTQIAMAVKPQGMIADIVCPRVDVGSEEFTYSKLISEDLFTIPDTQVGRTSEPNQVEFGAEDETAKVVDHGLDDFVPNRDINVAAAQGANIDPLAVAAEGTALLVELAREKRVADLYFNLNTYSAAHRTTLVGNDQWSDYANGSDPYDDIMAGLEAMLVRPNMAIFGRATWTKLRSHPKVVAMVLNNGGQVAGGQAAAGSVTRQAFADLLELDQVVIGEAFYNSAKKGQAMTPARLWGKHAAFVRIDRNVRSVQGFNLPTFAMTAQFGGKFAGTIPDAKRGLKGGTIVRVGEQVKELITFQDGGFFIQNAVA